MVIAVTGRASPQGCVTSRLRHFLDKWLRDGGEDVSFKSRPAVLYPQEDSRYSFLLEDTLTPEPYAPDFII
jgi:hypothetical protein